MLDLKKYVKRDIKKGFTQVNNKGKGNSEERDEEREKGRKGQKWKRGRENGGEATKRKERKVEERERLEK